MARKSAATVEEERSLIKRRYRRGAKTGSRIVAETALSDTERQVKREIACFLKAQDFSYRYIADATNLTVDVVKKWFSTDEGSAEMHARVGEIHGDMIEGAVKLMKTYAIELIEMLVDIARRADDDKVAIQAIAELLDRMGITKVNKSESAVRNLTKTELDIVDKTGIVEQLRDAPPEVQAAAARKMAELQAVVGEGTGWQPQEERDDAVTP